MWKMQIALKTENWGSISYVWQKVEFWSLVWIFLSSFLPFFHSSIVIAIFCQEKTIKNHNFEKTEDCILCSLNVHCSYAHSLLQPQKNKNWNSKPNLKAIIEENNSKTAFRRIRSWKKRKIMFLRESECRRRSFQRCDFDQDPLSRLLWS